MALTREIITADQSLSGLTDEQINSIVTLSENDEDVVIGKKVGEIYRSMDNTIATSTGIQRDGDEKTYNYLERVAKLLKENSDKADTLNKQVDSLNKEKTRLEKIIADGASDPETKKALAQAKKDLESVRNQYNTLKTEFDSEKVKHASELFGVKMDNELKTASAGLKFKTSIPKSVIDVLMGQTFAKIKGMNPEYIDNGKGEKILVYKDESGAIMRNPEKQLNFYTTEDLLKKEMKALDVLDDGVHQRGGGTHGGSGGSGNLVVDIAGAKTKTEANEIATKILLEKGLVNGSAEFAKEMSQIWRDNNIASLPEK